MKTVVQEAASRRTRIFDRVYALGVASFLVVITIGLITTNSPAHELVVVVRAMAAVSLLVCLSWLAVLAGINARHLLGALLFCCVVGWAVFAAIVTGSFHLVRDGLPVDIAVVGAGLMLFSFARSRVLPDGLAAMFVVYVVLALAMTIAVGGIEFGVPPRFLFEYASEQFGAEIDYGQGVSGFFGLGAIAAAFVWGQGRNSALRLIALTLALIFLFLSLLGGARGDSVIAVLVVIGYMFVHSPRTAVQWMLLFFIGLLLFVDDWSWLENLTFIQRMSDLGDGEFGLRDKLFLQVFDLLGSRPLCLSLGCGVGYFQEYHNYEYGMYPHNFLLEAAVIFGVPLTLLFIALTLAGAVRYYRASRGIDLFLLFAAYSIAVSLKSGSFFGAWLTLIACMYFIQYCFVRLSSKVVSHESSVVPGDNFSRWRPC